MANLASVWGAPGTDLNNTHSWYLPTHTSPPLVCGTHKDWKPLNFDILKAHTKIQPFKAQNEIWIFISKESNHGLKSDDLSSALSILVNGQS